jgi:hypothetical protein
MKTHRLLRGLALLSVCVTASSCQLLGIAANAAPRAPVKPKIVLADNSVGIMVWCDRGLRVDWPTIQKDLGNGVQVRLIEAVNAKAKELQNVTFPYPAESFVRWQRDHPGSEFEPIINIAPRLPVTRLIYIEIQNLSTRSSQTMAMYRGSASALVRVVGVEPGATVGKVLYEESGIRVTYPKHSTDEGRAEGSDMAMYVGTMTFLADAIAKRFVEHPAEDD